MSSARYVVVGVCVFERCLRVCLGLRGFAWVCVGLRGFAWVCVGLHGFAWVCVGLRGFAWVVCVIVCA
jgi:hypothetical protein